MSGMGPRTRASTPSGGSSTSDGRRRRDQPLRGYSTRQTSTPRSRGSSSSVGRHRGWKTRQAECTSASWRPSRPATGTQWHRLLADDTSTDDRRRVVNAGIRAWSRCQHREHASHRRPRGHEHDIGRSLRPAESASPSVASGSDRVPDRRTQHRRDRRRRADRGASSGSTSMTSTPPFAELDARYLAGEAAAHAHTWSVIAGLRRAQPARTPRDDTGLGQYRPPASDIVRAG